MRCWLFGLLAFAGCAAPEVTELYLAERDYYNVQRRLFELRDRGEPYDTQTLRELATDFEAIALTIPKEGSTELRQIEARAWLRATECHFDAVDSSRAELILSKLGREFDDLPAILGELSYLMGQTAELHGEYREAIKQYRYALAIVPPTPDRRPRTEETNQIEEETAADFVIGLPLRAARLAARATPSVDADEHYGFAEAYYTSKIADRSGFVRTEAAVLLADVLSDLGRWREASLTLDGLEPRIPDVVMAHVEPADVRLASFQNQVNALRYGIVPADSVRGLMEQLIDDYPYGDVAPTALYSMARCEHDLGMDELAQNDIARLVRHYPTAPAVPEAQLLRAQMYVDEQRLRDAQRTIRALPLEFPGSEAALRAPLEVIAFFREARNVTAERDAVKRAEDQYRDILLRYPSGPHSMEARRNLVTVLDMQGRSREALDELLEMCDQATIRAQQPGILTAAATRAETALGDRVLAAEIYQRLANEFPHTRLGQAAVRNVRRLQAEQGD